MGAIGGILIADYWVLRRQELSLPDLFKLNGRYTYSGGVNCARDRRARRWRSCRWCRASSARRSRPAGRSPNPTFLDSLYTYAWFVTFGLSFVLYLIVAKRQRD